MPPQATRCLAAAACLLLAAGSGRAEDDKIVTVVSPIFQQLLAFSAPARLMAHVSEHANDKSYLREAVGQSDTLESWTQMLTVSGARGLAASSGLTAKVASQRFAAGIGRSCPQTFSVQELSAATISGRPAEAIVAGCGSVPDAHGVPGATHSETALIVLIMGQEDLYTVQWAERGPGQPRPIAVDTAKWESRLRMLQPIKLCAIVPGEKAPYPSCVQ